MGLFAWQLALGIGLTMTEFGLLLCMETAKFGFWYTRDAHSSLELKSIRNVVYSFPLRMTSDG
jgi:hypothetical protein